MAMLLTAPGVDDDALARLELRLGRGTSGEEAAETVLDRPELESLRLGNPAARSLPILEAVACGRRADLTLASVPPQSLQVRVDPCC